MHKFRTELFKSSRAFLRIEKHGRLKLEQTFKGGFFIGTGKDGKIVEAIGADAPPIIGYSINMEHEEARLDDEIDRMDALERRGKKGNY
ncbi:hypothetical protein [Peribacillus simplex]|uniref:hypothetical protein n=1 Tax=Peribacillus simplex TaxID=1478 RepID=UPI003D2C2CCF